MQLPESPRWLLLNGRSEEARAVYETVARRNGVEESELEEGGGFRRRFQLLAEKSREEDEGAKEEGK